MSEVIVKFKKPTDVEIVNITHISFTFNNDDDTYYLIADEQFVDSDDKFITIKADIGTIGKDSTDEKIPAKYFKNKDLKKSIRCVNLIVVLKPTNPAINVNPKQAVRLHGAEFNHLKLNRFTKNMVFHYE